MAIDYNELFLEAFREYNLVRYDGSRVDLPRFQGLSLSEVVLGDIEYEANYVANITEITSETRRFTAANQRFVRANIGDALVVSQGYVSEVLSRGYPYEDVVTLRALAEPGLNALVDTDGTTVTYAIIYDETVTESEASLLVHAQGVLQEACNYELTLEMITITVGDDGDGNATYTITVDCPSIWGEVPMYLSEVPVLEIPDTEYGELGEAVPLPIT